MWDEPVKFGILDLDSGNSVSFFDNAERAESALLGLLRERPEDAEDYVLIAYNKAGEAVSRLPGTSLLDPKA